MNTEVLLSEKQVKEELGKLTEEQVKEDLGKLIPHFKRYFYGAYSALYLQLYTNFKIQDILEMKLKDVYYIDQIVKVKKVIEYGGTIVTLNEAKRQELAWYVLQRISVKSPKEEQLEEYLCVNTRGNQLKAPTYRKILGASSDQLHLHARYTMTLLRSIYGFLDAVSGEKPIKKIAQEYDVPEYYLREVTFKELQLNYSANMIDEIANVKRG